MRCINSTDKQSFQLKEVGLFNCWSAKFFSVTALEIPINQFINNVKNITLKTSLIENFTAKLQNITEIEKLYMYLVVITVTYFISKSISFSAETFTCSSSPPSNNTVLIKYSL